MGKSSSRWRAAGASGAVCLCLLAAGCAFFAPESPPFRYVSVELRRGSDPPNHLAAGIAYRIANTGELAITSLSVSFWIYEADGGSPAGVANNFIRATATVTIEAGTEVEICTSLDDVFYYVPGDGLEVANFRISSVELEDGTVWSDPFCHFVFPGPVGNVEV